MCRVLTRVVCAAFGGVVGFSKPSSSSHFPTSLTFRVCSKGRRLKNMQREGKMSPLLVSIDCAGCAGSALGHVGGCKGCASAT